MSAITSKVDQAAIDKRVAGYALQHRQDLTAVLSIPEGRRVLWYIIDDLAGLHGYSLATDSSTFINEGRRSVGGRLVAELQQASVSLYVQMTQEAIKSGFEKEVLSQGGQAA